MSQNLVDRLLGALNEFVLIDPHSHINPHSPTSATLADVLGYHYYTELAHSAGMPRDRIEQPGLDPREKVGRLVEYLDRLDNTVQLSWLFEMGRSLFDVEIDRLDATNWERFFDAAQAKLDAPGWEDEVLDRSGVERIFLTNDFDDPLDGFDTRRYIPCLRTDDLVFRLREPSVRERLAKATGVQVGDADGLRKAIDALFRSFTARGAKACAISLPPRFTPTAVSDADLSRSLDDLLDGSESFDDADEVARGVFWMLAERCREYRLPFDLMIGVNRKVYPGGVFQGQDLYDSRTSLIQYSWLFNAFPEVTFPISVLAETGNQELVSYAWIFPNVVTNGHWWYSNIPAHIATDLKARLQAVPQTKQIGYYSDAYKLEFVQPKFAMYKRILAEVLAADFVIGRGWGESRAVELGGTILRGNVDRIFSL